MNDIGRTVLERETQLLPRCNEQPEGSRVKAGITEQVYFRDEEKMSSSNFERVQKEALEWILYNRLGLLWHGIRMAIAPT
jgi:hypothetical protein